MSLFTLIQTGGSMIAFGKDHHLCLKRRFFLLWENPHSCTAQEWLSKMNKMNWVLGHLCPHIGWTGPGEPPEDGDMNEMPLPSRYRIRNSSPGGLRPSTLPLCHGGCPQYWIITSERGRNIFVSLKLEGQSGVQTRDLRLSKQAALTTHQGPRPVSALWLGH